MHIQQLYIQHNKNRKDFNAEYNIVKVAPADEALEEEEKTDENPSIDEDQIKLKKVKLATYTLQRMTELIVQLFCLPFCMLFGFSRLVALHEVKRNYFQATIA